MNEHSQAPTPSVRSDPLSPHDKALLKAGEKLLAESVEVGRDFCKSMIGVATGAVPLYLGLLKAFVPEEWVPNTAWGFPYTVPPALFMAAAVIFVLGYLPSPRMVSLDDPDNLERILSTLAKRRLRYARIGFGVLVVAVVGGVWCLFAVLSPAPTP